MKKFLQFKTAFILLIFSFLFISTTNAATIDFTSMADGSVSTIGDVTFSLAGAGVSGDPYITSNYGGPYLTNSIDGNYPTNTILRVDFASAVLDLSFDFTPWGINGSPLQGWSLFDTSLGLIASGSYTDGSDATYDLTAYSGIGRLELHNGTNNWLQGISRLEYNSGAPVPEPATMLLFGFGLLGLAGVNRRKK